MTALCLTRNRRQWLPKAIKAYQDQTYPNKELLILADGESVRDLIPDDDSIRLLELSGSAQVGEKRNLGCERARGEVIAVFDDDDWSAPKRLADQVNSLIESEKAVTGYNSMRFLNVPDGSWWRYRGTADFVLATSLCFRRSWWMAHPFANLQIGQDELFSAVAFGAGQLAVVQNEDLMYATCHSGNTSPRPLSGSNWQRL